MTVSESSTQRNPWRERGVLLLVMAVFLCGLLAIFAAPAERILFNPQAYKEALAEENAYDQFPTLLGEMIAGGGNVFLFGSGERLLEVLKKSNYEAVVRQVFPEQWVRLQADGLIDQFWAYFNFQADEFQLIVDFRPVKGRLNGAQSANIAAAIVAGFPPCSGSDIMKWGLQALQGIIDRLPLCKPPDQLAGAANLAMEGVLRAGAAAMPDQLDLAGALRLPLAFGGQPVSTAWGRGFAVYRFYRQLDGWLAPAALLLLLAAGLLARGTARGPLYWLGVALLLPGVAALAIALLAWLWNSQLVPFVVGRLFGENLVVFQVLVGMLAKVSARFMLISALVALGVTAAGAALIGENSALKK